MSEEIAVVEREALSWPEKASAIRIVDQATYDGAGQMLAAITGLQKQIKAHHKPIKDAAFDAHKAAVAAEKRLLDPLDQARSILNRQIGDWHAAQERIRREEEMRLAEDARKKEELRLFEDAINARPEESTEKAKAAEIPVVVPRQTVAPTFQKAAGISTRENWTARVDSVLDLCKAIAAGTQPENVVVPNLPVLNSMARDKKSKLSIPGVSPVCETIVVQR